MNFLLDTNVLIHREDNKIISDDVQLLIKAVSATSSICYIHKKTLMDINKDCDEKRRKILLSKLNAYPELENPPDPDLDQSFIEKVGKPKDDNDHVDHNLLYAVYKNAVEYLITEDGGIHKKAKKLNLQDRIFRVSEAVSFISGFIARDTEQKPPELKIVFAHEVNAHDAIFDALRKDYPNFNDWWQKISRERRKVWVYFRTDDSIGALLVLKHENEPISSTPPLEKKRRLKLCAFIVSHIGYKIGELFIKLSIRTAIENNLHEIYLTHFSKSNDFLDGLLNQFNFKKIAKINQEDLFLNNLSDKYISLEDNKREIYRKRFPFYYDGEEVNKYIVPIRPEYHKRLFIDYQRNQLSFNLESEPIVEGNAIIKAYLSHSKIKNIKEGDLLFFYRSVDESKITSIGVVEKANDSDDFNDIVREVGKRCVYTEDEICDFAKKKTKVLIFWNIFHLDKPIGINALLCNKILSAPPQTIQKISHEKYLSY